MNDRTLPIWLRLIIVGTAAGQVVFGLTLLFNPEAIATLWPWAMTPVTTRVLGASTLVSVPLAVLAALVNRYSVARIPLVMLLTYRVFQLVAGIIHLDRFDFGRATTWNYFGGGSFLLVVLAIGLFLGPRLGRPVDESPRWSYLDAPLRLGWPARVALRAVGGLFIVLGVIFVALGPQAAPFWFEEAGRLTPLTARLFASPMIGLALALWLISRAAHWREVAVPAAGMTTFGVAGTAALIVERAAVAPPSPAGFITAATAPLLLVIGLFLLAPGIARLRDSGKRQRMERIEKESPRLPRGA